MTRDPEPRRGGPRGLTDDEIVAALRACGGILGPAARTLGCSRQSLGERVRKNERLRKVHEDARAAMLDDAEETVRLAILREKEERSTNPRTAKWLLGTLGRDRGYIRGKMVDAKLLVEEEGGGPRRGIVVIAPGRGDHCCEKRRRIIAERWEKVRSGDVDDLLDDDATVDIDEEDRFKVHIGGEQ